ncbi:DsbA family protein [Devosia geojensis]|uniref:DsbA family protein n=1 Tax=Devosia geojensis TaxID=443610 RepID=UPI0006966106|nr:DsbA family protein [Devosia geojensis]
MSRLTLAVIALVGAIAGGAAVYALKPAPEPVTDVAAVRAIVEDVLAERQAAEPVETASAEIDPNEINPMIENYLMGDPTILQRLSSALDTQLRAEERSKARTALASVEADIYDAEGHVVLGNPQGDVTLVELFDYNCGYCRQALPHLAQLIAEDPNLRVILKEFPILSQESIEAARIGVLVAEADVDYWDFHETLFTSRGQVNKETALAAAEALGLSRVSLELDMNTERVASVIQNSYEIARALNITGTPTYIIGDEIIPGAIGVEELRQRIENVRECGSAQCES